MDDEKKKGLAALVIAMKPKGDKDKADADPKDKGEAKGFDVAAGEAFSALKKDDGAAFAKALKNAIKLHSAECEDK
jgi:hypothetical protein